MDTFMFELDLLMQIFRPQTPTVGSGMVNVPPEPLKIENQKGVQEKRSKYSISCPSQLKQTAHRA